MKNLKDYIIERHSFLVNKKPKTRQDKYEYHPTNRRELLDNILELLKKGITNLNCIDVTNITDMKYLFYLVNEHINVKYIDISEWNVSNVTNMRYMFFGCTNFNSDLSNWNVSKVKDMFNTFFDCKEFNSNLSKWDISNVKKMDDMLYNCDTLIKNNNIPKWYTGRI